MKIVMFVVTIAIAVILTVFMWVAGVVPFNVYTSALHLISIYIGSAAVLAIQNYRSGR